MEPYIAQIMPFAGNFAIRGWAFCDGQLLPISQNTALFSIIGTTFGGDGRTTFALPDLRGRSIVHVGNGPGLDHITWGERGGTYQVTLTQSHMANHTHTAVSKVVTTNQDGEDNQPNGNYLAQTTLSGADFYIDQASASAGELAGVSTTIGNTGGNVPLNIRNPFLGIYMLIALTGIFPSRN